MSFIYGMIIGFTTSIGLIIAFARYSTIRSMRRSELAEIVAAFARMTMQDLRTVIPLDSNPPWVMFSQRQKLTWLNHELVKIWPYLSEAASERIRSDVEPILEEYKAVMLASIKLSKLTLGTVAPQFTGVSILESESGDGRVSMELEVQWDGNPKIKLDIQTRVGLVIPVEVKKIQITGVFRLIFRPLVDEFPGFGAVSFSLIEKKHLDFKLKVVGGDISSIPGVSDAIEETIRDAIDDSITWPVCKIVPILPGDYSDLELKPEGILEVKLVQGKDLKNKDFIGKSDPYAMLFVHPQRDKRKTSKTINNELNPIWNEHFEFIVEDASTQHLTIRVFDDEGIQASELIGCTQVALKDLEPGRVKDVWLNLVKDVEVQRDNKYRGEVHLELLYCPHGTQSCFMNPFDPDYPLTLLEKAFNKASTTEAEDDLVTEVTRKKKKVILRGVLTVTVIAAENLLPSDVMGKADPFVVLMMRKSGTKATTRVLIDTLNPVWNQTFDIVVEDALHEMLVLEVYDHDALGKDKIGRCIMTLTRVILEGECQDWYSIEGTESGRLHLYLKWTPQPVFRNP